MADIRDQIESSQNQGQKTLDQKIFDDLKNSDKLHTKKGNKLKAAADNLSDQLTFPGKRDRAANASATWRSGSVGEVLRKDLLEGTKSAVDTAKESLNTVVAALEAVSSVAQLLEPFEQALTDPLGNVANAFIKQFRQLLDEAGSTGIYALNMFEPYLIKNLGVNEQKRFDWEADSDTYKTLTRQYLEDTEDNFDYVRLNNSSLANPVSKAKTEQSEINPFKGIDVFYKATTYEEFIETIADAFMDAKDTPGVGLFGSSPHTTANQQARETTLRDSERVTNSPSAAANSQREADSHPWKTLTESNFRTGRPMFAENSTAVVYVVAIQSVDWMGFIRQAILFKETFFGMLEDMKLGDSTIEGQALANAGSIETLANELRSTFERLGLKMSTTPDGRTSFQIAKDALGDMIRGFNDQRSLFRDSESPDFYGVTVKTMMPGLFELLQNLTEQLQVLTDTPGTGITQLVEETVNMITTKINRITRLIKILDDLINYVDDLLNMNFSLLKITSTKGVLDIYNQLMEAQGFDGAGTGRRMYIGGLVFAAGAIVQSDLSFDWQTFKQDSAEQFDTLKGEYRKIRSTTTPGTPGLLNKILKG